MKKNNKGFTLIELLAIIVILAIIAVITVPIILNIIENSRKGAATDSAYGYKDSVNKYYITELQNHNKLKLDGTYIVKSDGSLEPTTDNTFGFGDTEYGNSLNVAVSGTIPSSGKLRYSNNVLNAGCVVIGDYKVTFGTDGKVDGTVKGDCSTYEFPTTNDVSEQSGESGGGEIVESWNKYYFGSTNESANELPDGVNIYIREDTNLGKREICAKINNTSNGTVCFDQNKYSNQISKSNATNYLLGKIADMKNLGASCVFEDNDYNEVDNFDIDTTVINCDVQGMSGYGISARLNYAVRTDNDYFMDYEYESNCYYDSCS